MSSADTNSSFSCLSLWFWKECSCNKILYLVSLLKKGVACDRVLCSVGRLHAEVTLMEWENEWRGELHIPSRCCTTVTQMGTQMRHAYIIQIYLCFSAYIYNILMHICISAHTHCFFNINITMHLHSSSRPRESQYLLISFLMYPCLLFYTLLRIVTVSAVFQSPQHKI